ncbi:hypothetical protein CC2G_011705 [Coprinopsis cinerea AmutBmut pab1-1]|nr:hypothetical protein CC2G_011705 [Coprinopsis cinerea AmutBmut pab1-1]
MPVPDAHTRSKISLDPSKSHTPSSISSKTLPRVVLANVLFVVAIQTTKEWLLDYDVGAFWVLMRVLACGGLGALVWEGVTGQVKKRKSIEWSALAMASLLVFLQYGTLFTALYRLPSTRVVLFSHFSTYLITTVINFPSASSPF